LATPTANSHVKIKVQNIFIGIDCSYFLFCSDCCLYYSLEEEPKAEETPAEGEKNEAETKDEL
jgi:hypothetical protein